MIRHCFKKENNTSFLKEKIRKGLKKVVTHELGIEKISKQRKTLNEEKNKSREVEK